MIAVRRQAAPVLAPGPRAPRRVALLVSHLRGGGKEQCVVNLANRLLDDGWRPSIVCLQTSGDLEHRLRGGAIPVSALNKAPGNDPMLPWRLAGVLRRDRIDIVHCNNWGTLVEGLVAARLARIRAVVHTQHGLDYGFDSSRTQVHARLRKLFKRVASRGLDHIIAVSREVRDTIVNEWCVPADRVSVIHNGIEPTAEPPTAAERAAARAALGLSPSDFVIGSVGAFRPVKDYPTLIRAFATVARELPEARLLLIGSGPSRALLDTEIARLGLQEKVRLPGWRSDAAALLPLMDLFALPSLSEGISLAVLEAMAAGVPVIATSVGGNPEVIRDGRSGWLVPPSNPDALARAIILLGRDDALRTALTDAGRARASVFSLPRMVERYEEIYDALI